MTQTQAEEFFGDYAAAFNGFDALGVTQRYEVPCVFSQGELPTVFESTQSLLLNNRRLVDAYREDGFEHASFGMLQVHSFGPVHALVDVPWTIARRTPKEPVRFRTAYNLRHREGQWKIWAVMVYEEVDAFDAEAPTAANPDADRKCN